MSTVSMTTEEGKCIFLKKYCRQRLHPIHIKNISFHAIISYIYILMQFKKYYHVIFIGIVGQKELALWYIPTFFLLPTFRSKGPI